MCRQGFMMPGKGQLQGLKGCTGKRAHHAVATLLYRSKAGGQAQRWAQGSIACPAL